jgi:hypothetical protein
MRSETENNLINDICELVASGSDRYKASPDNLVYISYFLDKDGDPKKKWACKCC